MLRGVAIKVPGWRRFPVYPFFFLACMNSAFENPADPDGEVFWKAQFVQCVRSGACSEKSLQATEQAGASPTVSALPVPVYQLGSGTYTAPLNEVMSVPAAPEATIRYTFTTNGTDPAEPTCSTGTAGSGITVDNTDTRIKAIACADGRWPSPVSQVQTYTLRVATPTRSLPASAGNYSDSVNTEWATTTPGANLLYRTDGTDPDCADPGASGTATLPGGGVSLPPASGNGTVDLRVVGCRAGFLNSTSGADTFSFTVADPQIRVATYTISGSVSLLPSTLSFVSTTPSSYFCYSTGADPVCDGAGGCTVGSAVSGTTTTAATITLKARACRNGFAPGGLATLTNTGFSTGKRIFVSYSNAGGGLNDIAADALCNTDTRRPLTSATYKALRGSSTRHYLSASWPLFASTNYYRPDGLAITSTDSSKRLNFPFTNLIAPAGSNLIVWTGLSSNFTTAAETCADWTVGTAAETGKYGVYGPNYNNQESIDTGVGFVINCNNNFPIYCAEQ